MNIGHLPIVWDHSWYITIYTVTNMVRSARGVATSSAPFLDVMAKRRNKLRHHDSQNSLGKVEENHENMVIAIEKPYGNHGEMVV